ncbi:hypothetical protein FNU76_02600 [Chitinimonas arctica]|uniref:Uncharacterized protein n=1 Tax=Chitinimonas arctica TaxID=2594795 RepID=A0A516SB08_9NEIS|nr:hypothetical protein [Chitinimonas arctica]QDQ25332.1 hypothetical protein FNU76_02600 [Chitinimonas arctica]
MQFSVSPNRSVPASESSQTPTTPTGTPASKDWATLIREFICKILNFPIDGQTPEQCARTAKLGEQVAQAALTIQNLPADCEGNQEQEDKLSQLIYNLNSSASYEPRPFVFSLEKKSSVIGNEFSLHARRDDQDHTLTVPGKPAPTKNQACQDSLRSFFNEKHPLRFKDYHARGSKVDSQSADQLVGKIAVPLLNLQKTLEGGSVRSEDGSLDRQLDKCVADLNTIAWKALDLSSPIGFTIERREVAGQPKIVLCVHGDHIQPNDPVFAIALDPRPPIQQCPRYIGATAASKNWINTPRGASPEQTRDAILEILNTSGKSNRVLLKDERPDGSADWYFVDSKLLRDNLLIQKMASAATSQFSKEFALVKKARQDVLEPAFNGFQLRPKYVITENALH